LFVFFLFYLCFLIFGISPCSPSSFRYNFPMAKNPPKPIAARSAPLSGAKSRWALSGAAPAGRPSALVDTRVIYCGDNLDQLAKLPDHWGKPGTENRENRGQSRMAVP
jgi:hypothetical protein